MESRQSSLHGTRAGAFALLVVIAGAAGCASERGLRPQDAIDQSLQEAVSEPAEIMRDFAVPPRPAPAEVPLPEERFDIEVQDAEAADFFRSLVEGTDVNLTVHPDVTGRVSL